MTLRDMMMAFVGAAALMSGCWLVTGPSLGLFLGGMTLASVIAPPVALLRQSWLMRFAVMAGMIDGVAVVWMVACLAGHLSLLEWFECYALLIAWTFCAASIAWLARSLRVNCILASAIATALALAWLTAPIWLCPHLSSSAMQRLAAAHPLITINGVVTHLGIWTEYPTMYELTNLGQDVPYRFSPAWIVALAYAVIATALIALSEVVRRSCGPCDPPTRSTPPPAPTS